MSPALTKTALLVSYDGRAYHGWQRHPGNPTIQETLEEAIHTAFGVFEVIRGSGRTDRGAHAEGQVAMARLPSEYSDAAIVGALNDALPDDIVVRDAQRVPEDLDAIASAVSKTYRYVLWVDAPVPPELDRRVWTVRGPLDVAAMQAAAAHLVGTHDFATFATSAGFQRASTTRTMTRADVTAELPRIELTFEANGFLYKMVRNLVRAIVRVGEGRRSPMAIRRMLAAGDRRAAPGSAPASGLFLDRVVYDPPLFVR